MSDLGRRYRVFSPRGLEGGKQVTVFADASGQLAERAAHSTTPVNVFIEGVNAGAVKLQILTSQHETDDKDSASLAALTWLQGTGQLADFAEVQIDKTQTAAQLCGGEWLLAQGSPTVQSVILSAAAQATLRELGLSVGQAAVVSSEQPHLVLEVPDLHQLQTFRPLEVSIAALNRATRTTGLILYSLDAPTEPTLRRADVSFRAFGPLRGFLEDAASSNMCACLVAVLGERGQWPENSNVLRAAQLQPGQFSLLTAQFSAPGEGIWVGGRAECLTSDTVR